MRNQFKTPGDLGRLQLPPAAKMFYFLLFSSSIFLVCRAIVCPCERPELCEQIRDERDFEVYVFDVGGKTWKSYNWSMVTTVAAFGKYDAELMCYAHSKGARLVLKGDVHLPYIVDQDNRTAWITEKVNLAKSQFMDGINIDIEQAVDEGSSEYRALTYLVKGTTEAFHREIPGSQVSFDVAWSPNCIDKRCYDYVAIAESCDLLFVMSYDEQSQIMGDCIAMANAPLSQTLNGYDQFLSLKINPKKLVMGVPWYGYDYPCLNFSQQGGFGLFRKRKKKGFFSLGFRRDFGAFKDVLPFIKTYGFNSLRKTVSSYPCMSKPSG
ncbi:di-N-acetylchitobiase-like [Notothenia coriiceps]|uniref:Di-N-acetylchitobiase-like n=1 Tax=Notothenia coriiceps TaxID=8208 RepID=A0A6I9PV86_9TELE|nr:PREDICTED: di-N-acetylchitobiase-like [Notothenia coriiceps]